MACLLDANILLRLAEPGHYQHQLAFDAVRAVSTDDECVLIPQTLYEFWAVASRPLAANGLELPAAKIEEQLLDFQQIFGFAKDERVVYEIWRGLVREYEVIGPQVHDARYVAAMFRHQIGSILTFNEKDFRRYDGIRVIAPQKMA